MTKRVQEFLREIDLPASGPDTLVVVTPWQGTSIPWFSLALGLMLAREGAQVRFVIDDLPYESNFVRHRMILSIIDHVMKRVADKFPVSRLSDYARVESDPAQLAEIDKVAHYNATWFLRGEMAERGRKRLIERELRQNALAQEHISGLFESVSAPEILLIPNGLFGHSAIWLREARRRGARICSYDSGGYDTTMLATSGMACQLDDIPLAFRRFEEEFEGDPAHRSRALHWAEEEMVKRRAGTDTFASQAASEDGSADTRGSMDGALLIALNSSWDAAALGPHRVFEDSKSWIVSTVRFLLENTESLVVVRQHPAERLAIAATTDDYGALLTRNFGAHPRLRFIAAADPINSYALLRQARAIIVHTSTLGVEAAAMGVPAITSSASYYSSLGFVESASTIEEYEALLRAASQGKLKVEQTKRSNAMLCYYLTQCCNWTFSPFNPATFKRWVEKPLSYWYHQPAVHRMIRAMVTGTPVALLSHTDRMDGLEGQG